MKRFFETMICKQADIKILSLDITETKKAYQVCIMAPGRYPNDLRVFIEGDKVTVTNEKEGSDDAMPVNDFSFSSFRRSFRTLTEIDHENVKPEYKDDMIKLTLWKKQNLQKTKNKNKIYLHFPEV